MIRALIFDFDGLILDTEVPVYRSWKELYEQHGCQLPLSTWAQFIGLTPGTLDPYASLEEQLGRPVDHAALGPKRQAREMALLASQPIQPGVQAYLETAKRLGLKIGLSSSSSCEWVSGHLKRLDLYAYFESLRAAEDVPRAKPDPALYLAVLSDLGIPPEQAIGLEDSPNGVLAAKRAGLFCVAVPNDVTRQLPLDQADMRIESLADLSLEALIARLERDGR